jgi:hypothetical protein
VITARSLRLIAFGVILFGAGATAHAAGYWTCSGKAWIRTGNPTYPMPSRSCGGPLLDYPSTEAACKRSGGEWGPAGLSPQPICTLITHDAGQVCGDSGECEGACLADLSPAQQAELQKSGKVEVLGKCTARSPQFGCQAMVKEGFVDEFLCVD